MNELARSGRTKTIFVSLGILFVSLHTIYFYHAVRPDVETKKLIQQIIRFLFTTGLLIFTYMGKKWARIISIVLYSLAAVGALVGAFMIQAAFVNKIPLLVMAFVYSIAVYHFGFSKGFRAFYEYRNSVN